MLRNALESNTFKIEKKTPINSQEWDDYIEKQADKEYKVNIRNYAAEQLIKENPQGDRNRKEYLKSFTEQELAVLRNSESKGKVNPTLLQRFEGALKKGTAGAPYGTLQSDFLPSSRPRSTEKVETESLTDEEMKDVGALDLLGPLSIPAKLVQAGYKDGYSFLDALKGQENNATLIEEIVTDPLNLVGIGLVSKGANAAKLLKAYKNLSKLSNAKRASTLQNAYKLNPFAFKPKKGKIYRQVGKPGFDDAVKEGRIYEKGQKEVLKQNPDINYIAEYDKAITAKGEPGFFLEKPTNAPFFSKDDLFFPSSFKKGQGKTRNSGVEYLFEGDLPDEAFLPRYRDQYLSPKEAAKPKSNTGVLRPEYNDLSNFEIYKKDWLRGYKKIEVPTLNERLRNNPSYVIKPEVRSTEKLAKESEPYLKSSTPPRSRQDEIVEGFAPGLRQERIEKTTVNFNPDSSEIGKGFKSEIDWAKWNKDIPNNKPLIKEYNAIEEATKADGTWMKNPDGSKFTGTPEQFVQQQSKNFKAAFGESKLLNPDGSPTIFFHGTSKEFDTFDPNKFQLGDSGYSGSGIYTRPNTRTSAESYALSSAKFHTGEIKPTVMEMYGFGKNPIRTQDLPDDKSLYTSATYKIVKNIYKDDIELYTEQIGEQNILKL